MQQAGCALVLEGDEGADRPDELLLIFLFIVFDLSINLFERLEIERAEVQPPLLEQVDYLLVREDEGAEGDFEKVFVLFNQVGVLHSVLLLFVAALPNGRLNLLFVGERLREVHVAALEFLV